MPKKMPKKSAEKATATKSRLANFRIELKQQIFKYILAAIGLIAGLAWNDAIKASIEYLFPVSASSVFAKILYALLITLLVVIFSVYMASVLENEEKNKKPEEG